MKLNELIPVLADRVRELVWDNDDGTQSKIEIPLSGAVALNMEISGEVDNLIDCFRDIEVIGVYVSGPALSIQLRSEDKKLDDIMKAAKESGKLTDNFICSSGGLI